MSIISVELVPRSEKSLLKDLKLIKDNFSLIKTINVPDLLRFDIRSWEAGKYTNKFQLDIIPHIRAIDINLERPFPLLEKFVEYNIREVLVVTGDFPQDMSKKIYPTTSLDVIKKLKNELPELKVYGAIDPYRQSISKEHDYIMRKIDVGADGFFTQPFFDLRLMEIYAEILSGKDVFWGISPVLSENSVNYWETKNNVVFPADFRPNLVWNVNFATKIIDFINQTNTNIYFMPIKANLYDYLSAVLTPEINSEKNRQIKPLIEFKTKR
ncbi:methylenetetrahydrofolate reductase [Bacillota bacterium LX-D]|nr:methylenetetrahydrofolate reductase [Bacillota bacterium LX-D]